MFHWPIFAINPRSHDDLAWHFTWLESQQRFAGDFARALQILEADPRARYTLDGQNILALWWIESAASPDGQAANRAELRRLQGRLQTGPLLVLPDGLLAPPEAQIRNFELGLSVNQSLAAPDPLSADLSDVFGHPSQTAQLLRQFGIGHLYLSRGAGKLGPLFEQVSPDGSRVSVIHQMNGYGNGKPFGRSTPSALSLLLRFNARYGRAYQRLGVGVLPLFVGGDQSRLSDRVLRNVDRLSRLGFRFLVVTNDELAAALEPGPLPEWHGRLMQPPVDMPLLRGVNSTRLYMKQVNERLERLILSGEAAWTLASLSASAAYPRDEYWQIWREYLKIQSHDGITGCHVDEVALDIMALYAQLEGQARDLRERALRTMAVPAPGGHQGFWNPLPYSGLRTVITELPAEFHGTRGLTAFIGGRTVQVQRLGAESAALQFHADGFGGTRITLGSAGDGGLPQPTADRAISNGQVEVIAGPDGRWTMRDLELGRSQAGGELVSDGDGGDTYTYDPVGPRLSNRGTPATVRRLHAGPILWELEIAQDLKLPAGLVWKRRPVWWQGLGVAGKWLAPRLRLPFLARYKVPARRSRRLVTSRVVTKLRLTAHSRVAEVRTAIDNQARDHRLRVVFPLRQAMYRTRVLGAFAFEDHPLVPPDPRWASHGTEAPVTTQASQGLVTAGELVVMTRGLPETELTPDGRGFELTALRCVHDLARLNPSTRLGPAGPSIPTPDAQCQGRQAFEYAVALDGDADEVELVRRSQVWRYGLIAAPAGLGTTGILPVTGDDYVFSALTSSRGVPAFRAFALSRPAAIVFPGRTPVRVDLRGCPAEAGPVRPCQIATFDL